MKEKRNKETEEFEASTDQAFSGFFYKKQQLSLFLLRGAF